MCFTGWEDGKQPGFWRDKTVDKSGFCGKIIPFKGDDEEETVPLRQSEQGKVKALRNESPVSRFISLSRGVTRPVPVTGRAKMPPHGEDN